MPDEPRLTRAELPRLTLVALLGAVLAPAALAWGLQRSGPLAASLLLNLEAVFTFVLAVALYGEPLGGRALAAGFFMVTGGAALSLRLATGGASSLLGLGSVCLATLAWALDNTLTRTLSDFDPRAVVLRKGVLGVALSTLIAAPLRESWPATPHAAALFACGAAGYGMSLRLYLRAQRVLGAARTGSLFALGPFVGGAAAFALGDRQGGAWTALAAASFALAVYLHLTERHRHRHIHEPIEHEHSHRHDDGHHTHAHDPPFADAHSHSHRHDRLEHDHPHAFDLHHHHKH